MNKQQAEDQKSEKVKERETTHLDVLLYVPNLIGYLRFIFNFISVRYAFDPSDESWMRFVFYYSISQMLDAIDGTAARKFNQCSHYGAALDMISDRTSCATIYAVLMALYPDRFYSYFWFMCFILDFGSHYL